MGEDNWLARVTGTLCPGWGLLGARLTADLTVVEDEIWGFELLLQWVETPRDQSDGMDVFCVWMDVTHWAPEGGPWQAG